jgi:hypothetical protein
MNDVTSSAAPGLHGGCLCGNVRYTVAIEKPEGYYCHCRMCQLAFGNTRAAFLNVRKDHVHWHGQRATYASSKIALRGFCGTCGTPLSFEYNGSERMDLAVGSLDDPAAISPVSHFAVETRIGNWHADDGLPGDRLDSNQTILSRWREAYGEGVAPGLDAARGRPT